MDVWKKKTREFFYLYVSSCMFRFWWVAQRSRNQYFWSTNSFRLVTCFAIVCFNNLIVFRTSIIHPRSRSGWFCDSCMIIAPVVALLICVYPAYILFFWRPWQTVIEFFRRFQRLNRRTRSSHPSSLAFLSSALNFFNRALGYLHVSELSRCRTTSA